MHRIVALVFVSVIACNSKQKSNVDVSVSTEDTITELRYTAKTPLNLQGCYSWVKGNDTATLQLAVDGNNVTGNLVYDWSEKDRNSGKLQGVLRDSLLITNYTFKAEGTTSVREVAFKLKGDSLLEGFGDVTTNKDTIKYKNISRLKFHYDHPFVKGICK